MSVHSEAIMNQKFFEMIRFIDEIGRMIGAWINKLKEQGLFS